MTFGVGRRLCAASAGAVAWIGGLCLGLAPGAPAASPPAGAFAASWNPERPGLTARLPDGRRLNFRCLGAGGPTVLLEGGFGATAMAWFKVAALAARTRRVCAYDRAGSGFSDPGPLPRDGAAIARDLDAGLRALRLTGPYILVGHSSGGLYVRAFYNLRPRRVVGMVLVDPSVEHQDQRFAAEFGPGAGSVTPQRDRAERCLDSAEHARPPYDDPVLLRCLPSHRGPDTPASRQDRIADALRRRLWQTQVSELDALWTATSDEVAAGPPSYGSLPLIVLTADGTNAGVPAQVRPELDSLWRRLHQDLATRSTRGRERLIEHASHMMMFDRPDAIADAINEVAAAASDRQRQ